MSKPDRYDRLHSAPAALPHNRSPGQRDRDRILYSDALQRLANVTQVASPGEGIVFHNRLTHTHEVAQIARRLAEKLCDEQDALAERLGGIDPDVVEAAALAHDLGHPPFGHIAEDELDRLARANHAPEGFEGNAQSFRIVVHSEAHRHGYRGLDLTRATLNALLKYPWLRDTRSKGADPVRSIEAAIMDHADAIAYSVHDLDDFYRAGLIPVETLVMGDVGEWQWFSGRWRKLQPDLSDTCDRLGGRFRELLRELTLGSHYTGDYEQRVHLRTATSRLINDFIHGVRLEVPKRGESGLWRDPGQMTDLEFLQALVRVYVINNPRLATQQHGQRQIIRTLFNTYLGAIKRRNGDFVPALFRADVDALPDPAAKSDPDERKPTEEETRLAVDIVASFTDAQAVLLHKRLTGTVPGSITELLHA